MLPADVMGGSLGEVIGPFIVGALVSLLAWAGGVSLVFLARKPLFLSGRWLGLREPGAVAFVLAVTMLVPALRLGTGAPWWRCLLAALALYAVFALGAWVSALLRFRW